MKQIKFERIIKFYPGFDHIVLGPPDKAKYGRHGMEIRFLLKGEKGTIHFLIYTHWLPMVEQSGMWQPTFKGLDHDPMAVDISWHSPKPLRDDEDEISHKKCEWIGGKPCYSDGSSLYAKEFMAEFFNKGEDALFKKMEEFYKDRLSEN